MKKIFTLCFAIAFLLCGCVKEDDIVILGSEGVTIDNVDGSNFNLTVRLSVENKSGSKVKLSDADFIVYVRNRPTIKMTLTEDVILKKRRVQSVAMPVCASMVGGVWAILPLAGELSAAGISTDQLMSIASGRALTPQESAAISKILRSPNITVKATGRVKAGLVKRDIEVGPMTADKMLGLLGPRLSPQTTSPAR